MAVTPRVWLPEKVHNLPGRIVGLANLDQRLGAPVIGSRDERRKERRERTRFYIPTRDIPQSDAVSRGDGTHMQRRTKMRAPKRGVGKEEIRQGNKGRPFI